MVVYGDISPMSPKKGPGFVTPSTSNQESSHASTIRPTRFGPGPYLTSDWLRRQPAARRDWLPFLDIGKAQGKAVRVAQQLRWQCPRCGVDLTELVQTGKVVLTRMEQDHDNPGRVEEQVRCRSCDKLVKPELTASS